jgi:hypothetical protein
MLGTAERDDLQRSRGVLHRHRRPRAVLGLQAAAMIVAALEAYDLCRRVGRCAQRISARTRALPSSRRPQRHYLHRHRQSQIES